MCACRFLDLISLFGKIPYRNKEHQSVCKDVCCIYNFASRPILGCVAFYSFGLFNHQSGITPSARRLLTWCWIVFVNLQIIVRANRLQKAFVFCCIVKLQSFIFLDVDGLQLDEVGSFGNWPSLPCHPKPWGIAITNYLRIAGILRVQRLRWWHWIRSWLPDVGALVCGLWQKEQDFFHCLVLPAGGYSRCGTLQYSPSSVNSTVVVLHLKPR